ncbi:MAG: hybrid sensor histidine kinase/response regulator [Deltaproteobacteria bacterium]|nr:MAG: hybrid sensor histidine kinase/response regulator [Deltaproteobacteria bacterium]
MDESENSSAGENVGPSDVEQQPTIVIVDDEPLFLEIVTRRIARHKGWNVVSFEIPTLALNYLSYHTVDVVLSDIHMNEMDGIDFLERVNDLYPDTVQVLMTNDKDRNKAIEAINRLNLYFFYDKDRPWDDMDVVLRNAIEKRSLTLNLRKRVKELEDKNQQLREIKDDLIRQKKRAVIGELIQGTCHNINTPLGVILGNVELVRYQLQLDSEQPLNSPKAILDKLGAIQEAAERVQDITYNLMLKSKMDQSPQRQETSINTLVKREIKFLQADAFLRHRVALELELEPSQPKVFLNYGDLSQVFGNIVRNALDAVSHLEEPKLRIVTSTKQEKVIVEIHDNGPGVPEDLRARIFDPFFSTKDKQAKPSSKATASPKSIGPKGGIGLGLYSASALLAPHQGTIEVTKSPLEGACFQILLPVHVPEETPLSSRQE